MHKRIKLTIAYDGTRYCGWQIQENGITVEEMINKSLSGLLGEKICIMGASRTDAGVHALGNVAVFDTHTRIPPEKISYGLNQRLPEDITVQKSEEVPKEFHPRYAAAIKTYEYKILNRTFPQPICRLYTHFIYYPLDVEAMQKAAAYLVGEHDFKSFSSIGGQTKTSVRTITALDVEKEGDIITIRVSGTGFLYNMVRIISGTLIQVGQGYRTPESVQEIIEKRDRRFAGPTAPPRGLTLIGINFTGNDDKIIDMGGQV
ncbi:tRNA pseudouridine(38-40) synthase TruA [Parasporobacterium paucivorans]|uniref:tRNA pseudouridine synthase A n=1 Tax=Parasporobacterium paucivorans DSM 15970 TaxID=1122934 RepID=A0A1M6BLX2_9FIRM|nr:tRNA pseudouridine(38-40) synthase TruA [Parasporobacterium paucivorans]SHI49729.1 tRNA pseudouridine38-40 synthase [Parasporobacterium paucivorans DSM 15970]